MLSQQSEGEKPDRVIVLRGGTPGAKPTPPEVTQRDLIEERALSLLDGRARRAVKHKRQEIRRALDVGAEVEEGVHSARLEVRACDGYTIPPGKTIVLIIE